MWISLVYFYHFIKIRIFYYTINFEKIDNKTMMKIIEHWLRILKIPQGEIYAAWKNVYQIQSCFPGKEFEARYLYFLQVLFYFKRDFLIKTMIRFLFTFMMKKTVSRWYLFINYHVSQNGYDLAGWQVDLIRVSWFTLRQS